jgi:hypothetical protein
MSPGSDEPAAPALPPSAARPPLPPSAAGLPAAPDPPEWLAPLWLVPLPPVPLDAVALEEDDDAPPAPEPLPALPLTAVAEPPAAAAVVPPVVGADVPPAMPLLVLPAGMGALAEPLLSPHAAVAAAMHSVAKLNSVALIIARPLWLVRRHVPNTVPAGVTSSASRAVSRRNAGRHGYLGSLSDPMPRRRRRMSATLGGFAARVR